MFFTLDISPRALLVILIVGIGLLYLLLYWRETLHVWKLSYKIPGPWALPFIGNGHQFLGLSTTETFQKLQDYRRKYGRTVKFWIGNQLVLVISEPVSIEKAVTCEMLKRSKVVEMVSKEVFGDGLILNGGDVWRKHRKLVSGLLHNNILETYVDIFAKNAVIFTKRLAQIPIACTFDAQDYSLLCAMDALHETLLNTQINCQVNNDLGYCNYIYDFLHVIGAKPIKPWLFIDIIFKFSKLQTMIQGAADFLQGNARKILHREREKYEKNKVNCVGSIKQDRKNLMEVFIENGTCNDQEIIDEAVTMMIAGAETIATGFCFALVQLADRQDIQDKVVEEQRQIFGDDIDRPVTSDDLQRMTYLEKVVKEVLRMFPPVSFISRQAVDDLDLGNGYVAPRGAELFVLIFDTHRDPELYSDPLRFDPERFSPENSVGRHPYAYVPFGGGRRICPGMKYAVIETKIMLSTVLRKLRLVKAVDGLEAVVNSFQFGLVMTPSIGFKLQIEPRT